MTVLFNFLPKKVKVKCLVYSVSYASSVVSSSSSLSSSSSSLASRFVSSSFIA